MAAQPVDLNGVLAAIGFNAGTRAHLVDAAFHAFTMDSLLDFREDEDYDAFFSSLKRPGGEIGVANNDLNPLRANPGYFVNTVAADRFRTACYMAQHRERVGRDHGEHAWYTTANMRIWKQHRLAESSYEDQEEEPKLLKNDEATIIDFIEEFPEILTRFTGTGGRPLAYVLRKEPGVPLEADQIAFGFPNSPFSSVRDEVWRRSTHDPPHYTIDNNRVFELLRGAVSEHKRVLLQIKPHTRTKDGRSAWLTFVDHYMGAAQLEGITIKAEERLDNSVYSGEKPRYTYETHVCIHQKAHIDLVRGGNTEMDDGTKIRKFLKTITAQELQIPIATIKATQHMRTDWNQTINYLRNFVTPAVGNKRNVSAIEQTVARHMESNVARLGLEKKEPHVENKQGKDLPKVAARFYKASEWRKLVKAGLHEKVLELRKQKKESEAKKKKQRTESS